MSSKEKADRIAAVLKEANENSLGGGYPSHRGPLREERDGNKEMIVRLAEENDLSPDHLLKIYYGKL